MCGITGFIKQSPDLAIAKNNLTQMLSTLSHRGPDGWGLYVSNDIALGHTRLAIVDLAGGKQPIYSDQHVMVYNGEIYNYVELREELKKKGVYFKTKSDTEVVLRAYEAWGTEAFTRFNGQFALIIWNRLKKQAIVARDRFGVRPLYVLHLTGSYYFASELKAFDTIAGFQRHFSPQHLFQHGLLWNTMADATVYDGIRSVASGTYEIFRQDSPPVQHRYYEIGESPSHPPPSFAEAQEQFRALLNDAVSLRLRSDVPVGAYLSGGIDSSVISQLVNQSNNEKFKTFSVAFTDKDFDESSFQQEMIRRLNCEHICQTITYEKINKNLLDAVYHFERPVFRTAPVPLFLLSAKVQESDIKVVLTGEGADEILYGYDSFKELKLLEFWSRIPSSRLRPQLIKKLYPHIQHYSNPKQFGLMKMYYEGFLAEYDNELAGLNIRVHNNKILANFFNKDLKISFNKEELQESIKAILPDNFKRWSILQQNSFLEMKSLLSGYLLSSQGDRMSLAHGVEGRYPFLDHRLVEYVFHLPDSYKMKILSQKHLLTETFKDTIPSSITRRPKRPYMAPDLKSFFHNGKLTEQAAHFLDETTIKQYGIFDTKYIERFLRKFKRGVTQDVGYRDNMIITFILSTQMTCYWARHPKIGSLDTRKKNVEIIENYG